MVIKEPLGKNMCKIVKSSRRAYISLDRHNLIFRNNHQINKDKDLEREFYTNLRQKEKLLISEDKFNSLIDLMERFRSIEKFNNSIASLMENQKDNADDIEIRKTGLIKLYAEVNSIIQNRTL